MISFFSFFLAFLHVIFFILAFFLIFTAVFLSFLTFLENFTFVEFIVEVCSPLEFVIQKSLDIFRRQNIFQLAFIEGSTPETVNMTT